MKLAFVITCILLAAGSAAQNKIAADGSVRLGGWPLGDAEIRQAIEQSGIAPFDVADARISSPPDFRTRARHPQLELLHMERTPDPSLLLASLRCRVRADCRSFLVELSVPNLARDHGRKDVTLLSHDKYRGITKAAMVIADRAILVSPREMALLVIEEESVRITQPVRPAKSARLGETVRVTDPVTHRSLLAEVIGPGMVRPRAPVAYAEAAR